MNRRTFLSGIAVGLLVALAAQRNRRRRCRDRGAVPAPSQGRADPGWRPSTCAARLDGSRGRTSLARRYAEGQFQPAHRPGNRACSSQRRRHRDSVHAPASAAKSATTSIPIVILTQAIRCPGWSQAGPAGGNVTGSPPWHRPCRQRLELLKEAVPNLSRVAVLFNAAITRGSGASRADFDNSPDRVYTSHQYGYRAERI